MTAKRVRWTCPNGCPGVLGPTKPRRDNIVRYCLACSAKAGKLIQRSAPAIESKRQASSERAAERRRAAAKLTADRLQAARERRKAKSSADKERAEKFDKERHAVGSYDLRDLVRMAESLPSLKPAKGTPWTLHRKTDGCGSSGHAKGHYGSWHMSVDLQESPENAAGLIVHELAHIASQANDASPKFGRCVQDALDEWNERYPELQINAAKWGAYRGKFGRRNKERLKAARSRPDEAE